MFADKLFLEVVDLDNKPATRYINLNVVPLMDPDGGPNERAEAYELKVHIADQRIDIAGQDVAGLLHGVQTLISIAHQGAVPNVEVFDYPRFSYRGKK